MPGALGAFPAQRFRLLGTAKHLLDLVGDIFRAVGIAIQRGIAAALLQRGNVGSDYRAAAGHRFDRRQGRRFIKRGEHQAGSIAIELDQLIRIIDLAGQLHPVTQPLGNCQFFVLE